MQPDQYSYPIDYLNQIAPEQPKKRPSKFKLIFIGLGVAVVIVVVLSIIAGLNSGRVGPARELAIRLKATETIVKDAQKNIVSSNLRSYNSNLQIFLVNTNRDIAAPLATNNIDVSKISEAEITKIQGDALQKSLENARLNATFDRTYVREITYQLSTIYTLMKQVYTSTNSKSLKQFLETSSASLAPIQKQISDVSSASS